MLCNSLKTIREKMLNYLNRRKHISCKMISKTHNLQTPNLKESSGTQVTFYSHGMQ